MKWAKPVPAFNLGYGLLFWDRNGVMIFDIDSSLYFMKCSSRFLCIKYKLGLYQNFETLFPPYRCYIRVFKIL